jgi:hypothetical protein
MAGDKSIKTNDRERAFVYLRAMTDEKGKKARIALAGAFGEMLNRVFDQLEKANEELATWRISHDWIAPLPESATMTITPVEWTPGSRGADVEEFLRIIGPDNPHDLKEQVDLTPGAETGSGNIVQESTTEAE